MRGFAAWISIACLTACAAGPSPELPRAAAPADDWCRALYSQLDAQVAAAGVAEQGAARIDGYPYLRVDRLLAALGETVASGWPQRAWIERRAALDLDARRIELSRLASATGEAPRVEAQMRRLRSCSAALIEAELASNPARDALREVARVPDDYSLLARTLGLYPLALPFLKLGVSGYQDSVAQRFEEPLPPAQRLQQWWPAAAPPLDGDEVAAWIASGSADPLGIPKLNADQWRQLAAAHAPVFWIETVTPADTPGRPMRQEEALGFDRQQAPLYVHTGYTRFDGVILPQLTYTLWFSERTPQGSWDPYAGQLDGVVWRVTLGVDGRPLLYDSIHACGCYHLVFPVQKLIRRAPGLFSDPMLIPQQEVPTGPVAVLLDAGDHQVRRVLPRSALPQQARRPLALTSYRQLLLQPDGEQALFDDDGLVSGSERSERFWLWPTGVRSPGAMRQAGRQATAFVGRRHFDDPDLFCEAFVCEGAR